MAMQVLSVCRLEETVIKADDCSVTTHIWNNNFLDTEKNYEGTVCIRYQPKKIWVAAEAVSTVSLIAIGCAGIALKRKKTFRGEKG